MSRVFVAVLAFVSVFMITSGVFAQGRPCAGDIARFCSNVPIGEGRMAKCLKQNEVQLSPACKVHLIQVKEALKEAHQACEDDIAMFCGGVKPGGGRIMQCLKANQSRLSVGCKVKLFEAKENMK